MMENKPCFFRRFEKKAIFGILEVEYATDRQNAAENHVGDNGFCSKSAVQNIENLDFFAAFESFHFQLHHISEWAKSDRISPIWLKMKSELGLRFFRFLENIKNLSDMSMDLAGIWKMSRKRSIFFPATIDFLKLSKIIFYRFWANASPKKNCMTFSAQKPRKLQPERSFEFRLSMCAIRYQFEVR